MKLSYIFWVIFIFQLIVVDQAESQWKGKKEEKDGIIYMRNPEQGLWHGKKKMNMKLILTIGVLEGNDDYILANPYSVITDKNGNIYICDIMDDCVKVFDSKGVFIRKIGRKGQGPGEFIEPKRMIITNDGQLCILSKTKLSYFTLEGHFLQSFKWKEDGEERIVYIDHHGYAYTLSGRDETPCVRKYKITFGE